MIPRILSFNNQLDLIRQLRDIKVDEYGIKIMAPKADSYLIKLERISSIAANILKQEMLSLGGDVAISRRSITGADKFTACLLMGNLTQLNRLIDKLKMQPFRLCEISSNLKKVIADYRKDKFKVKCRNYTLDTSSRTLIMGIINVTTDSFSGDGLLSPIFNIKGQNLEKIVLKKAEQIVKEGADIIDIGAESSRPGSKPIDTEDEIRRLLPCLKVLVKEYKIPISVDTYKPQVAKVALDLGISIVNDITGLKSPQMKRLISKYRAGAVIMHMKGAPRTMQKNPKYESLVDEIISFLKSAIDSAIEFGISPDSLILDPGIGFGKTVEHNLEIIRRLKEFKVLGRPILLGVSRKSFIGKLLNRDIDERIFGCAAAVALSVREGADIVRVHDIEQMRDVLCICDAVYRQKNK